MRPVPCEPAAASARSSRSIGRDTTWTTPPEREVAEQRRRAARRHLDRSMPSGEIARQ
jgi:hypothetical protein